MKVKKVKKSFFHFSGKSLSEKSESEKRKWKAKVIIFRFPIYSVSSLRLHKLRGVKVDFKRAFLKFADNPWIDHSQLEIQATRQMPPRESLYRLEWFPSTLAMCTRENSSLVTLMAIRQERCPSVRTARWILVSTWLSMCPRQLFVKHCAWDTMWASKKIMVQWLFARGAHKSTATTITKYIFNKLFCIHFFLVGILNFYIFDSLFCFLFMYRFEITNSIWVILIRIRTLNKKDFFDLFFFSSNIIIKFKTLVSC